MLGGDVLLFPDFGSNFIKTVKTSAFYCERITSTSVIVPGVGRREFREWLNSLRSELNALGSNSNNGRFKGSVERVLTYLEFIAEAQPVLGPLVEAKVLRAPSLETLGPELLNIQDRIASSAESDHSRWAPELDYERWLERFAIADGALIHHIRRAQAELPPSFVDALQAFITAFPSTRSICAQENTSGLLRVLHTVLYREKELPEQWHLPFFGFVLAVAIVVQEQTNLSLLCTDSTLQDGIWAAHRILRSDSSRDADAGGTARPDLVLGTVIAETYLPCVHDLPVEEILSFRARHESEMEAFRVSLAELSAEIDLSQTPLDIQRQATKILSTKVNPAVRDLRSRMKIARLEALQRLGRSSQSLASLAFSSIVAVLAGAPLDIGAYIGLAGSISQALIEGEIERRKLMHASQWSVLLRLNDLQQHR